MREASARIAAAAAVMTLLAGLSPAGQSPAASGKDALNVLARMVEAMGGRKALAAVKDTTLKGTAEMVSMGLVAPITIYQKEPDKLRIDLDLSAVVPGRTFTQAFDGTSGWGTNVENWRSERMSEALSRDFAHQAVGNGSLLDPQRLGVTYGLKPRAALEGKDYIVLEQTLADGHKTTIFVDPDTHLAHRTATTSVDPVTGAAVETESTLGDYRKVGGLMVNHSLRTAQGGAEIMRLTVSSVAVNTGLADALFQMK